MSYIHKALNKAQRDKDSLNKEYDGLLSAHGKKTGVISPKAALLISAVIIACIAAFAYYSWFGPEGKRTADQKEAKNERPAPSPPRESPAKVSLPDKVANRGRANPKVIFDKARAFHKSGGFKEAKRLYQEALKIDPQHIDALNNLGVIYMHEKDLEAAESTFKKIIGIKPGYADTYYNLACVCAMKGDIKQGIVHLKKAIALNSSVIDWAREDSDLQGLRSAPEFEKLTGSK